MLMCTTREFGKISRDCLNAHPPCFLLIKSTYSTGHEKGIQISHMIHWNFKNFHCGNNKTFVNSQQNLYNFTDDYDDFHEYDHQYRYEPATLDYA